MALFLWRKYTALGLGRTFGRSESVMSEGKPDCHSSVSPKLGAGNPLHDNNAHMIEVERKARYHWLSLLIEWDKKDVISELLKTIENDNYFIKRTLNNALQVALEHNRQDWFLKFAYDRNTPSDLIPRFTFDLFCIEDMKY